MNLDKGHIISEQGVKFRVKKIGAANVCIGKAA